MIYLHLAVACLSACISIGSLGLIALDVVDRFPDDAPANTPRDRWWYVSAAAVALVALYAYLAAINAARFTP